MSRRERYRQLLSAARQIVNRGGIDALNISSLTEATGVSRPVVYEHFPNSEAISIALLEDYFETMIDLVDSRTRDCATLEEYVSLAIDACFEYQQGDSLRIRNLTNGHATGERLNAAYFRQRQSSIETFEELLLQQGTAADVARVGAYTLAEIFLGVVFEFSTGADQSIARQTLKKMVVGAIHTLVPTSIARPATPGKILQTSREFKQRRGEST
jgi:AcrR family transcriptional regulator